MKKEHGRTQRARGMIRQWRMMRVICRSHYVTVRILAERFEMSMKTIRRDIMCLESAGFPLYVEHADGNQFIRMDKDWFLGAEPKAAKGVMDMSGWRNAGVHGR